MEQQPPERALPPWLVGRTIPTGSRGSAPRAMKVVGMYIVASYPMADRVANEGDPRQMMYSSREMSPDPIAPRAILRPAILLPCTVGLVVLLLSGCAGSQGSDKTGAEASSSSLEKGLVAHWCFHDPRQIGTDYSKGGYDGFVSGTPQVRLSWRSMGSWARQRTLMERRGSMFPLPSFSTDCARQP